MCRLRRSDRTKSKGEKGETLSLLYIYGFFDDKEKLDRFIIDVANDLNAVSIKNDQIFCCSWTLQSKWYDPNIMGPNNIGKLLISLYENYFWKRSGINFKHYILFVRDVNKKIKNSININKKTTRHEHTFNVKDIDSKNFSLIKKTLECEISKQSERYGDINTDLLDDFLDEVVIVTGDRITNKEYISKITYDKFADIFEEKHIKEIFDEIKEFINNHKDIEITVDEIHSLDDMLKIGRDFSKDEIAKLLIKSYLDADFIKNKRIPNSEVSILKDGITNQESTELSEKISSEVINVLMNNHNQYHYWNMMNDIWKCIVENYNSINKLTNKESINHIYDILEADKYRKNFCLENSKYSEFTIKYFIMKLINIKMEQEKNKLFR